MSMISQLQDDIEEIEKAEQKLCEYDDIWQNRMILMIVRVIHHILVYLVKRAIKNLD